MGEQTRGSGKIVVCLQKCPQRMIPIFARLLNMQLTKIFEQLPAHHIRFSLWTAVLRRHFGMFPPMYLYIVRNHTPTNYVRLSLHIMACTSNTINQCEIIARATVLACSPTACLFPLSRFLDFCPEPLWRLPTRMHNQRHCLP